MKDRQYWIDRGSQGPKEEGYVCVGKGDVGSGLWRQLGVKTDDIGLKYNGEAWRKGFAGSTEDIFYYLKEEKFNELFPIMEDATEVKDRDYWIKRGSEFPQFEGMVCVGMRGEEIFQKELGLKEPVLALCVFEGSVPENFCYRGQDPKIPYYLKSEDFDKLFPIVETVVSKDRQYWLDRGKDGKQFPDLVCIGKGVSGNSLDKQLGIFHGDMGMLYQGSTPEFGLVSGNSEFHYYYLKQSKFEKDRTIYTDVSRPELYEEITLNDLYTRDLFPKQKPISVRLNGSYTAEVHPDKIVVGCQTFSMEVFEELRKAVEAIKA